MKLPSGNESTVSIRDLAPCDNSPVVNSRESEACPSSNRNMISPEPAPAPAPAPAPPVTVEPIQEDNASSALPASEMEPVLRRSSRVSKALSRLINEI